MAEGTSFEQQMPLSEKDRNSVVVTNQSLELGKKKLDGASQTNIVSQPKIPVEEKTDIFNPEMELQKIHSSVPKANRPQALKEFKQKLAYQREGLARIQTQLIDMIRKNPDQSLENLYEIFVSAGSGYGVTEQQKELTRSLIKAYVEKHALIKETRQRYPDDKKLFRALFGKDPTGKIEVIEGPITFYFRCKSMDDYAFLYKGNFSDNQGISPKDKRIAGSSGGFLLEKTLLPGLSYSVIAENSSYFGSRIGFMREMSKKAQRHEEQHAMKQLFGNKIKDLGTWEEKSIQIEEMEKIAKTPQEKEEALLKDLRFRRQQAEEKVRDEILAYCKSGASAKKIYNLLTKPKDKGGLYDFLAKDKGYMKAWFVGEFGSQYESMADRAIQQVYVIEYGKLLKDGIGALQKLRKTGYPRDQAIAVLIHEPLPRWEKVARRLVENRQKTAFLSRVLRKIFRQKG